MTDRPKMEWTDEEIEKAWAKYADAPTWRETIRGILASLGAVPAAECREREREAYLAGCAVGTTGEVFSHLPTPAQRETVNYRFPSLTPPPPPALRLSTGEWTRKAGYWYRDGGCSADPKCNTASDARALAAWLAQYGSGEERK